MPAKGGLHHGRGFADLDLSYLDEPRLLRKAASGRWDSNTPRAKFLTFEPVDRTTNRAELRQRMTYLVEQLKAEGATTAVAVYSFNPRPHIHAVVWTPRKWRHRYIKDILARIGLRPCGDPKKAIQTVSTERADQNKPLWAYLAKHIERLPGLKRQWMAA